MWGATSIGTVVAALAALALEPVGDTGAEAGAAECVRPTGLQRIVFSAQKYPNVRRHFRGALRRDWPRRLVLNRRGADEQRERLLRDIPTREGFDRDEYPPTVGRGAGRGWSGSQPASLEGWKADVRYVPRSHGATLGDRLERFCNGTALATSSADSLSCAAPLSRCEDPSLRTS